MAPNVNSPWITIRQWNSPISLRNQKKEREQQKMEDTQNYIKGFHEPINNNSKSQKEIRPFQPRANYDPIKRIDEELAKLREAPSKVINEKRRYVIRVELGTFNPESVQVVIETEKLSVQCEEELQIDERTTIVKRFTRRISVPIEKLRTELIATEMNTLGTLTITLLKR